MIGEHYKEGRASALSGTTNYELVERLRTLRESGDAAMWAAEEYDPNFSLKLAAALDEASADALLAEWLQRRLDVLTRTRNELRAAWHDARPAAGD